MRVHGALLRSGLRSSLQLPSLPGWAKAAKGTAVPTVTGRAVTPALCSILTAPASVLFAVAGVTFVTSSGGEEKASSLLLGAFVPLGPSLPPEDQVGLAPAPGAAWQDLMFSPQACRLLQASTAPSLRTGETGALLTSSRLRAPHPHRCPAITLEVALMASVSAPRFSRPLGGLAVPVPVPV